MLYFMGYTDSPTNWTGNFTRAVKEELIERGIAYKMLPPGIGKHGLSVTLI